MSDLAFDYRTAEDIRHTLRIGFQPAIQANPEMLRTMIWRVATGFIASGVTPRRLDNALAKVYVDPATADELRRLVADPRVRALVLDRD